MKAPIDERVVNHINHMVSEGISNVGEMKRQVKLFVKDLLLSSNKTTQSTNRRFFPSRQDLRKLIYRQRVRLRNGLLDQDFLEVKLKIWQADRLQDFCYYRKNATVESIQGKEEKQNFLLIYQTWWQKKLLHRYGNEFVLLDATYKTTQYALPLFFLCVQTNVGYFVVASIVLEHEDTASLTEALEILRTNNITWQPAAFMVDASEVEINAIHAIFKGIIVLLFNNKIKNR